MKFSDLRKAESRHKNFQLVCSVQIGFAVLRIFLFVCLVWIGLLIYFKWNIQLRVNRNYFVGFGLKCVRMRVFLGGERGEGQF